MSPKNPININPAHKGQFARRAQGNGRTVQQEAEAELENPRTSQHNRAQAQFAKNAANFNHPKRKP